MPTRGSNAGTRSARRTLPRSTRRWVDRGLQHRLRLGNSGPPAAAPQRHSTRSALLPASPLPTSSAYDGSPVRLSVGKSRWARVRLKGSPAAGCSTRVRTPFPDWDDSGRMAEPARDRGFVAAANRYLQVVG